MGEVRIRPMQADDVADAERISSASFLEVDRRTEPRSWPEPTVRSPDAALAWQRKTAHLVGTDPRGCWVAGLDGRVVGFVVSLRRELTWVLASYNVDPGFQGAGVGAALYAVAAEHGKGCLRGLLSASDDPRALRRYRADGFDLHPQVVLRGEVDRSAIPVDAATHVREGSAGDRDLLDSLDRRVRGAAHGPDHDLLLATSRLLVVDRASGSGYAYVGPTGAPRLLAATDRRTATRLMWEALASSPEGTTVEVDHVTGANQWALDVGLAARLDPFTGGYLGVRGLKPPTPYLHHGSLL